MSDVAVPPTLVLVTGPAGAGKTTLARDLGAELGWPVVSRDALKQGMTHAAPGFVPAPDDPLTMRTYSTFFDVLALLARAGVSLVAEAAFQHELWSRGLAPLLEVVELRVLRCTLDPDTAQLRARDRLRDQPALRAAHSDALHLAGPQTFAPLTLAVPTLDVDTTVGYVPDLVALAAFARR